MEPVGVAIPAWLVQRKIILYYLIIRDCCWNNQLFADVIQSAPGGEFYEMVSKHMNAFTAARENAARRDCPCHHEPRR